ncbi:hypothetical protein LOB94_03635 [Lactobacillus delbrueckii subsp. bulgaricus]|uniref:hypothetical protein n=1 Tax=Lactobacillus delbrueckii TaxID=1584 RepID=UPI00068EDAC0|nr:hypothetical protein [Lactobacillus delbrueckii]MCD5464873.1 hypothetical protein [Lactobacillus delbrueckii subsp. bulgaricus]MCD5482390.1 hypothetical protein [Lactobacillus delbrueckii subsp. bulgaricus]MCD5482442.1 hypothetical protein [Lactobacillus delbrueckii subsp. bulgaricus]
MYYYARATIKNGRPYTYGHSDGKDWADDALITDKSPEVQKKVFDWIKENIVPRKTPNDKHSSYGLKHYLEHDIGIYLTNNEFKDAMLLCGFKPVDETELNWEYCISEKPISWRVRMKKEKERELKRWREQLDAD